MAKLPKASKPKTCAEAVASIPFNTGDLVVIKSGGPIMTVRWVECSEVECMWFDREGKLESVSFSPDCLRQPMPCAADDIPF